MCFAQFTHLHEVAILNKKDTLPFKTEPRHESGLLSDNVSISSLLNKLQNVNNNDTKFSLDVDSDGNKLTQQQAEYFKNSKVRDEDGNLLKVYHGTSESFTIFS